MKDIHGERPAPGRIPVLSPTLHCIAMTALVYLRASFGFTLFRPRTIFFALSVAVAVFDYIAWHEPDLWQGYRAVCTFSGGAVALYWLHYGICLVGQWRRKSEPDDYSGRSHALRVLKSFGISMPAMQMHIHLWVEPAAVLLFAATLRYAFNEHHLSAWLVLVAACIIGTETLNYWTEIRREKIAKDITAEAEDRGKTLESDQPITEAPQAARVAGQTIPRKVVLSEEEARAKRFGEVLEITEPYDLDEAEANYHRLIQLHHPDTHGNSSESNQRTAELNEAIEFFRERVGG